jgi:hypothetical protein
MTNEARLAGGAAGPASGGVWWRRWPVALFAAFALWAMAAGQLLVSVPRSVTAARNFNMRLPWHMEAVGGTPVWALVAAAVAICLLGLRLRGWPRLVLLVGVPVAVVVAIHLSVHETQAKLLWGLLH